MGNILTQSRAAGIHAAYGITDRIQVKTTIPFQFDQIKQLYFLTDPLVSETYTRISEERNHGLSDLDVSLAYQVVEETGQLPSITTSAILTLPTGRKSPSNIVMDSLYEKFDGSTGSGEFALKADLRVRKIFYPFSFELFTNLDYSFGGEKIFFPGESLKSFKSGMIFTTQTGINFHLNDWICMTNDIFYIRFGKDQVEGELDETTRWQAMWVPSIHFQFKQLRLAQAYSIPLAGRNHMANHTYYIVASYVF
jgi:hypothetical protein